jgi:hypothetical protein
MKRQKNLCSMTSTKDENEDEDENENVDRKKNSRKKKVNFQNKCVSSQNKQYEKRRGRYRSGYTLPSLTAGSFDCRAERAVHRDFSKPLGETH